MTAKKQQQKCQNKRHLIFSFQLCKDSQVKPQFPRFKDDVVINTLLVIMLIPFTLVTCLQLKIPWLTPQGTLSSDRNAENAFLTDCTTAKLECITLSFTHTYTKGYAKKTNKKKEQENKVHANGLSLRFTRLCFQTGCREYGYLNNRSSNQNPRMKLN